MTGFCRLLSVTPPDTCIRSLVLIFKVVRGCHGVINGRGLWTAIGWRLAAPGYYRAILMSIRTARPICIRHVATLGVNLLTTRPLGTPMHISARRHIHVDLGP